jgi:hypothetical protein
LEKDGRLDEAQRLFDERFVNQPRPRDPGCTHLLFLFSVDDPTPHILTHGLVPAGNVHHQIAAVLLAADYERISGDGFRRCTMTNAGGRWRAHMLALARVEGMTAADRR